MTYGELFAGAGGFGLGLEAVGMRCQFQVEIDNTARAVLARHWPDVPRRDDVRECGKKNLPQVDVLTFGFPCQDLSVAGQRKGLQGGTRSGLFYEAVRIGVELRCGIMVWENVPGLLSSDDGRDFARVLRHLGDSGYHGAWRVLDAQHFGLAQRRKRVFGVFARGHSGAARCAEVLALRESVQRHHPASGEAGEEVAGTLGGGSGVRGWCNDLDRCGAFVASDYATGQFESTGLARPLTGTADRSRGAPIVAGTLSPGAHPGGFNGQDAYSNNIVAIPLDMRQASRGGTMTNNRAAGSSGGAPGTGIGEDLVSDALGVRRLTPRECERLQGWPDDHTRYRADGSEIADGPRYRLIGNGVASPCAEWIARRLVSTS